MSVRFIPRGRNSALSPSVSRFRQKGVSESRLPEKENHVQIAPQSGLVTVHTTYVYIFHVKNKTHLGHYVVRYI